MRRAKLPKVPFWARFAAFAIALVCGAGFASAESLEFRCSGDALGRFDVAVDLSDETLSIASGEAQPFDVRNDRYIAVSTTQVGSAPEAPPTLLAFVLDLETDQFWYSELSQCVGCGDGPEYGVTSDTGTCARSMM